MANASAFETPSSSSLFLSLSELNSNFEKNNSNLTQQQLDLINQSIILYKRDSNLYACISGIEYRRLKEEMENALPGAIFEAYPSLSDSLCGADRRYFWKKTPIGIFQVNTNTDVTKIQAIIFDP